jgi:hypothetical protein
MLPTVEYGVHHHLPDVNRLSVIASAILLAYAITPLVSLPEMAFSITLPLGLFTFSLSLTSLVSVLTVGMAAAGTDWLLKGHPHLRTQTTVQHWIVPALTAWVIGVPLGALKNSPQWWGVFALGGLLLVLVLAAEYIVVDFEDTRVGPATIGLTALSFALFLLLVIALRGAATRLYLLVPTVGVAFFLLCLRTLYLRLNGRWCFTWSIAITVLIAQVALGLHYLPLSPPGFGLVLLGLAYALISLAVSIEDGRSGRGIWLEPVIMLAAFLGLIVLLGG